MRELLSRLWRAIKGEHVPSIDDKLTEHQRRIQAARALVEMYRREVSVISRGASEKNRRVRP